MKTILLRVCIPVRAHTMSGITLETTWPEPDELVSVTDLVELLRLHWPTHVIVPKDNKILFRAADWSKKPAPNTTGRLRRWIDPTPAIDQEAPTDLYFKNVARASAGLLSAYEVYASFNELDIMIMKCGSKEAVAAEYGQHIPEN